MSGASSGVLGTYTFFLLALFAIASKLSSAESIAFSIGAEIAFPIASPAVFPTSENAASAGDCALFAIASSCFFTVFTTIRSSEIAPTESAKSITP